MAKQDSFIVHMSQEQGAKVRDAFKDVPLEDTLSRVIRHAAGQATLDKLLKQMDLEHDAIKQKLAEEKAREFEL